jgi:hypothetical protein
MPYADRERRLRANRESHARNPHIRRTWAERNPEKRAAHVAVGNAVRDGRLVKGPCERVTEGTCRGKIEAHHDDYSQPLRVRWFCTRHHKEEQ